MVLFLTLKDMFLRDVNKKNSAAFHNEALQKNMSHLTN